MKVRLLINKTKNSVIEVTPKEAIRLISLGLAEDVENTLEVQMKDINEIAESMVLRRPRVSTPKLQRR